MKIMKKAAAILLAGVLVMGTAVPVFASSYPSRETSSTEVVDTTAGADAAGITGTAKSSSG